jgi:hypothetical protein
MFHILKIINHFNLYLIKDYEFVYSSNDSNIETNKREHEMKKFIQNFSSIES